MYEPTLIEQMGEEQFEYLCKLQHERETSEALERLYRKNRCSIHNNSCLNHRHKDKTPVRQPWEYEGEYEINSLCEIYCDVCENPEHWTKSGRLIARIRGWHQNRWLEERTDDERIPEGVIEKIQKKVDDSLLKAAEELNQMYSRFFL